MSRHKHRHAPSSSSSSSSSSVSPLGVKPHDGAIPPDKRKRKDDSRQNPLLAWSSASDADVQDLHLIGRVSKRSKKK